MLAVTMASDTMELPAGIDPQVLDPRPMVNNFGGLSPIVHNLYELFLTDEADLLVRVRRALAAGDLVEARLAAHSAAGAARTAGAPHLAGLCSAVENAIVAGDPDEAHRKAARLEAALEEVRAMVARI